jgi:predicted PurR-regulated permease PerM
MKIVIIILIVLITIYLINNMRSKSLIEGNENFDPELSYYKDKFQNLVNKLKQDKEKIDNWEKYYNAIENIYKCLDYRSKLKNIQIERERTGTSNQTDNAGARLDSITSEAPNLNNA